MHLFPTESQAIADDTAWLCGSAGMVLWDLRRVHCITVLVKCVHASECAAQVHKASTQPAPGSPAQGLGAPLSLLTGSASDPCQPRDRSHHHWHKQVSPHHDGPLQRTECCWRTACWLDFSLLQVCLPQLVASSPPTGTRQAFPYHVPLS
jgi:hypothetical protein